ncbi:hypothetical protein J7L60_02000 [Candidatus Bathyarchaeota archaeon]|nr:hypothetical protein [Candidatus Bathyarchaeota archaeon]
MGENLELRSRLVQLELQHAEFRKKVLKEVQELKEMLLGIWGGRRSRRILGFFNDH